MHKILSILVLTILLSVSNVAQGQSLYYDQLRLIDNVPLLKRNKNQIDEHKQKSENYLLQQVNEFFDKELKIPHHKTLTSNEKKQREKKLLQLEEKIRTIQDSLRNDFFQFKKLQLLKIENSIQIAISEYVQEKQMPRPYRKAYLDCHESGEDITDQLIRYLNVKK